MSDKEEVEEYVNKVFEDFLEVNDIKQQLTVPHTPQQNGVDERFNRKLVEIARAMLVYSELDEPLWAEAVSTAAYLRNRSPTKALDNCKPYEVWYNRKPNVQHLKIFAYRLYERGTGKTIISRDVYFIEDGYNMWNKPTGQAELNKEIITMKMEPLGENIVREEVQDKVKVNSSLMIYLMINV